MQKIHKQLLQWYKINGRHDLPWRNTNNLYHIYISEIMLQQTQINRVRDEYYFKFLEKFPTLNDVSKASQSEIFSIWSGLGYYSRANNIHKTAKLLQNNLPTSLEELLKLPGIGIYTASAICSFGLNYNITVIDTNISRVLKRFFAIKESNQKILNFYATKLLNSHHTRDHNLALMDLGSLICKAKNPLCQECPLESFCKGKLSPELYTKTKKIQYEKLDMFLAICIKNNKIALEISKQKLYKDMLILPNTDAIDENFIGKFNHSYTKYKLSVHLYKVEKLNKENIIWVDLKEFDTLAISSLTKKAKRFIV